MTTSLASTLTPTSTVRSLLQTKHQMAVPQGAMPRENWPATTQAVVKLLEVISGVAEELQGEEEVEKADLVDLVEESPEHT